MDLLEDLLGLGGNRDNRRRGDSGILDGISDTIRGLSKWIIGCGCLLIAALIAGIIFLLTGIIEAGEGFVVVLIVIGAIIAAIASIIRLSIGDRYSG